MSVQPRYVQACAAGAWRLQVWLPPGPRENAHVLTLPYTCGSWRHRGRCRRLRASADYHRIRAALEAHDPAHVAFLVLTFDRLGTLGGKPWASRYEAFVALSRCWRELLRRLDTDLDRQGHEKIGSRWVGVAEQHRTGWPHFNAAIVSPYLAQRIGNSYDERRGAGLPDIESRLVQGILRDHVVASGFGARSTADVSMGGAGIAFYVVKMAAVQDEPTDHTKISPALPAELAKLSQVPEASPPHFRRIRAGVRFLPPRPTTDYTGILTDAEGVPLSSPEPDDELERYLAWSSVGLHVEPPPKLVPEEDPMVVNLEAGTVGPMSQTSPTTLKSGAVRPYVLRPHDPSDPRQRPRAPLLVPDQTSDEVYSGRRMRQEPSFSELHPDTLAQPPAATTWPTTEDRHMPPKNTYADWPLAFVDIETTGLDPVHHDIIEIAVLRSDRTNAYVQKIKPMSPHRIAPEARRVTGYNDAEWADAPSWGAVVGDIAKALEGAWFVAHSGHLFDLPFLRWRLQTAGHTAFDPPVIDTMALARAHLVPRGLTRRLSLRACCLALGIEPEGSQHRALAGAQRCRLVYQRIMALTERGAT